ncbi:MAG: alpha/beta fold hydrolase [Anaerolineales bacterium]
MAKNAMFTRSKSKIRFQNEDLDFIFQWLGLGYGVYGGLSYGEAFAAANEIDERDLSSWIGAFRKMGDRLHRLARESDRPGHRRSAGENYLKAFAAYRAAAQMVLSRDPSFRSMISAFQSDFQCAMAALDIPISTVQIPYAGKYLTGYFLNSLSREVRGRTMIGIGGGDTYPEDLYFFYGAAARTRGYNILMTDLPGQGSTPFDGLFFDVEFEKPVRAVVDFALARGDVDPDRLAIAGVSGGGYMVLRAAACELRIRAVIANSPILDMGRVLDAEIPPALIQAPKGVADLMIRLTGRFNTAGEANLQKYLWQAGLTDLSAAMELGRKAIVDPARIACPILCLSGEGESAELQRQTRECYDRVRSVRKDIRIFTAAEGADAHCQVNNLPLWNQVLYDWLDDVL